MIIEVLSADQGSTVSVGIVALTKIYVHSVYPIGGDQELVDIIYRPSLLTVSVKSVDRGERMRAWSTERGKRNEDLVV